MQDIRAFMRGGAKAASKESEEIKAVPDAESATPGKSGQPVSLDLTSSPGPSPGRKRKAPATNKRGPPAKKTQVVLSESDGDDDFELSLASDSDSEVAGKQKKMRAASKTPPSKPAVRATPPKKQKASPSAPEVASPKARTPTARAKIPGPLAGLDPVAVEAVEAVDAAAKKLPPEEALKLSFMSETSYAARAPDEPPNAGTKAIPKGHPDCLTGKTFVISGVLDSMKREEAEDLIRRHGGKVTGNVSGRTSFLVIGQYAGRSKHAAAQAKGTPVIDEGGLLSLVEATVHLVSRSPDTARGAVSGAAPAAAAAASAPGSAPAPAPRGLAPPAATPRAAVALPAPAADQSLWVEKWRPKTTAELVGNNGLVATLRQWLREWEAVHLHGREPSGAAGARGKGAADLKKRAVLISGPPGIGKTTAALCLCRELGLRAVEVNASDTRSKADASALKGVGGKLANAIKELTTNAAVSYSTTGTRDKLCLIMDEVDGMSAGDRGGVADFIQTIHKTRTPIIAICNDKYHPKLRSLRNHCLELEFRKPTVQQITKRAQEICRAEGLAVNDATLAALIQSANGGDIRLIVGQLQMVRRRSASLSYDQVKTGGMGASKDLEMSPFEAGRRLLGYEGEGLSLSDQTDLVFQDADLVPLLVQENYINHRPKIAQNDTMRMQIIAKAADAFSAGDLVNRRVRQTQNWALSPFAVVMGTIFPATYMRGGREVLGLYPMEPNFPRFTAWLGNFSSSNKQRRLLGELHTRMTSSGSLECDRTALRLGYLPVLRNTLVQPLARKGKEGIEEVLHQMADYSLAREDIDFITDVTKWKTKGTWGEDPMKPIETQVKSAFTRAFNAQHLRPKTGFKMEGGVKKKGRGGGASLEGGADEFGEEGEETQAGAEEEEEEELDPVVIQQKLMAMKHKGMSLTLKDGSTAARSSGKGGRGRGSGGRSSGKAVSGRGGRGKK
ncbi:RFC1 [Auxenochlorella protothecoides x Auxenochlorella symbiontica]